MTAAAVTMPVAASGIVLAAIRVVLFIGWAAVLLPFVLLGRVIGRNTADLRRLFFRVLCRIFGIDVVLHGAPAHARPLLIASNHISYLDIFAFGSIAELEFVSKEEVASWPVFGFLAKAGDTVFIDRRRSQSAQARDSMSARLAAHRMLVFFPEATSGDGNRLLPFKSALFAVAQAMDEPADGGRRHSVTVQPAAIAYTRLNGLPTGFGWRPFFAWYGDMTMVRHLWQFLQLGKTTVEIVFLPPLDADALADRKTMAAATEAAVRKGFNGLIQGRVPV